MEVQRIGIPFPARTPMRYPYLAQVLDTSQTLVKGVPAAPVEVVGQAGAGEPLSLAALDHIASRSSLAGLVAPAVAEEVAALRCPLVLSIYVNKSKISFISYYVYIFK